MFSWFRRKRPRPSWAELEIYRGLSADELQAVGEFVEVRSHQAGEFIVKEGDPAFELHLVKTGQLEVVKRGAGSQHQLATLGPSDVIGEVGAIDEAPRSASVRALSDCELITLRFHDLRARAKNRRASDPLCTAQQKLVLAIAQLMSRRLRGNTDTALATAMHQVAMGHFLVNVLILLCAYVILLGGLPKVSEHLPSSTSVVSIPLQLLFAIGSFRFIRRTGFPLHTFGLSFRHAIGSLLEALIFTVPFLALLTAIKWFLVSALPAYRNSPLIEHPDVLAYLGTPTISALLAVYALSSVVQELIVRSALQSSLQIFLMGPKRKQHAILLSALLFSVTHLHMSFLFAVLAFVPGLFWGFLYSRRPNLLGVSLSHTVVGGYVFFVLGTNLG